MKRKILNKMEDQDPKEALLKEVLGEGFLKATEIIRSDGE